MDDIEFQEKKEEGDNSREEENQPQELIKLTNAVSIPETLSMPNVSFEQALAKVGVREIEQPWRNPEKMVEVPFQQLVEIFGEKAEIAEKRLTQLKRYYDGSVFTDLFEDHESRRAWRAELEQKIPAPFREQYLETNKLRLNNLTPIYGTLIMLSKWAERAGRPELAVEWYLDGMTLQRLLDEGKGTPHQLPHEIKNSIVSAALKNRDGHTVSTLLKAYLRNFIDKSEPKLYKDWDFDKKLWLVEEIDGFVESVFSEIANYSN